MAEFNYTEYLKNNPLLQEEVKEKLLTESQEISEEIPSSKTTVSALKAQIKEMILDSLKEEPIDELFDDDDFWKSEKAKEQEKYGLKPGEKPHVEEADIEEPISEGPSTEEKRIAMMAAKKQAAFRDVSLEQAIQDQINALEALKREMNEEYNTDPNTTMYIDDEEWEKEMGRGVQEADEEEDVEVDVEDEVDVEAEPEMEPAMDAAPEGEVEGLTSDEKEIQDALKLAYDNAVAIGDQKLADQIGNSITFFTRTHVVER